MNSSLSYLSLPFYQNANTNAEQIIDGFLIRLKEYEIIINDIRNNPMEGSVQHYLLLGKRGSGKSTLLRRIQVELDTVPELSNQYISVNPAEEQANIYKLYDLLELILQELEERGILVEKPEENDVIHEYTKGLFFALHLALKRSAKKVVLLLDNIDRIFDNLKDEDSLLREYLLNYKDIRIIGASTRMTEHFWNYNRPFYEFFRVLELNALSNEEVRKLLLSWSERLNIPALKQFVESRPGQLETVRTLTDGLPRTLQFFLNILLTYGEESGYEYLHRIMDDVTPLYQERLNNLPPSQRKIVLQMAFFWEAVGTGELAEATKMNNRVISAQLSQLIDKGVAEKIETKTKNHLYRLAERFFNLWLIFTQGSPREKRRARYLTVFLENFYDVEELENLARNHLAVIEEENVRADKAVMVTKAFVQSKYISSRIRDQLIESTRKLPDLNDDLKKMLPLTDFEAWDQVPGLIHRKEWKRAFEEIELLGPNSYARDYLYGLIYLAKGEYEKAEASLLKADGIAPISDDIASLYDRWGKPEQAEAYYKASIVEGNPQGLAMLGSFYRRQEKFELSEEYFLKAFEGGDDEVVLELALVYQELKNWDLAEKFFLLALEDRQSTGAAYLAALYYSQNKNKPEALSLLNTYLDRNSGDPIAAILFYIVELWNGVFQNLDKRLREFVLADNKYLDTVLLHLLVHGQTGVVTNAFADKEIGSVLRERFVVLLYTVEAMTDNKGKLPGRVPPEIANAVYDVIEYINTSHDFYYK